MKIFKKINNRFTVTALLITIFNLAGNYAALSFSTFFHHVTDICTYSTNLTIVVERQCNESHSISLLSRKWLSSRANERKRRNRELSERNRGARRKRDGERKDIFAVCNCCDGSGSRDNRLRRKTIAQKRDKKEMEHVFYNAVVSSHNCMLRRAYPRDGYILHPTLRENWFLNDCCLP